MRTIHITIPYHVKPGRVEDLFEQLLNNIHNSISHETISFELVSLNQHIYFYMTFTDSLYEFITGQIYAIYPDAEILETKDYISSNLIAGKQFYGAELGMMRSNIYPTQTYTDFEKDPLSGVFSILSKVQNNEMGWVQVIVRKRSDNWQFHIKNKWSRKMYAVKRIFSLRDRMKRGSGVEAKALEKSWFDKKIEHHIFDCSIRLMVWASDREVAKGKLHALAKGFFQINTPDLNEYEIDKESSSSMMLRDFKKRSMAKHLLLNTKELATVYHIPNPDEIPNTVYVMSRKHEPPLDLPKPSEENKNIMSTFGITNYHNSNVVFGISREDRRRHMYCVGKSGSGKSKLLELLINQDIQQGFGVAVLDPHGDLVDDVMRMI